MLSAAYDANGSTARTLCHPACPGVPWDRTRISYYAAPEMATCAAFIEESRMKFADPTKLDRKFGEVEGSAVLRTSLGYVRRSRKNARSSSPLSSARMPLVTSIW